MTPQNFQHSHTRLEVALGWAHMTGLLKNPHQMKSGCIMYIRRTFTDVPLCNLKPAHATRLKESNGASHTHTHTTGYYEDYRARGSEAAPHMNSNKQRELALITLIL